MIEIIPGILEKDWREIERKIELVRPFAKTIHIDIVDGKFAANTTFLDPKPFAKYTNPSSGQALFFELHMIVEEPINYLKPWAGVGFRRFLGHVEKMGNQAEFIAQGQMLGEVGLALDGPTALDTIGVAVDDLDALLFMGIKAGFSGQALVEDYVKKMEILKDTTWIPLAVDGGINDQTIVKAAQMGATRFVSTSFLFNGDPKAQYDLLNDLLAKELEKS